MMGDTDFSAQIARLAVDRAGAGRGVHLGDPVRGRDLSVKQIREQGIDLPIVCGDGFDTELVATVPGPELADEVYFSTHTYRADDRPEVAEVHRRLQGRIRDRAGERLRAARLRRDELVADAITAPAPPSRRRSATRWPRPAASRP